MKNRDRGALKTPATFEESKMKMSFGYIRSSLPLALALALCVAMPGLGQDAVWVSTEDGFFHDADNWQNLPPGESEDALFGVDAT